MEGYKFKKLHPLGVLAFKPLTLLWCYLKKLTSINRPCGKESTEVRITQNKGKESENSYQKLKRSP